MQFWRNLAFLVRLRQKIMQFSGAILKLSSYRSPVLTIFHLSRNKLYFCRLLIPYKTAK